MNYKSRIADQILRDKLDAMGAVLIESPKACGKTTTAAQQAARQIPSANNMAAKQSIVF